MVNSSAENLNRIATLTAEPQSVLNVLYFRGMIKYRETTCSDRKLPQNTKETLEEDRDLKIIDSITLNLI